MKIAIEFDQKTRYYIESEGAFNRGHRALYFSLQMISVVFKKRAGNFIVKKVVVVQYFEMSTPSASSQPQEVAAASSGALSCFKVFMSPDVTDEYLKVLYSGYIAAAKNVDAFENALRKYLQNDHLV